MAREFTQTSFFDMSQWSNVYYAAQFVIEQFLADVLMRSDLTRIVYASDAYSFRRRFELSDSQGGDFDLIKPTGLNFPFANYWYDGFWTPDDRPFAIQTKQLLYGLWDESLPSYLRTMAVKASFPVTVLYNRDDDARLAYELLMWEYLPRGPIQLATKLRWKDVDLAIPVYITIEDIVFNPTYNETDWLKTHRIVPIRFKITARTYTIGYPRQTRLPFNTVEYPDNVIDPPFNKGTVDFDGDSVSITEEVILEFAAAKQWVSEDILVTEGGDLVTDSGDDFIADVVDVTTDIVTGYLTAGEEITINAVTADDITMDSFLLNWTIKAEDIPNIAYIKIVVPGQPPIIIEDTSITSYLITGLQPSSEYGVILLFYGQGDIIRDFHLTVTTLEDPDNPVKVPLRRRLGKLKGMEW